MEFVGIDETPLLFNSSFMRYVVQQDARFSYHTKFSEIEVVCPIGEERLLR